jgi:hypothetical protein
MGFVVGMPLAGDASVNAELARIRGEMRAALQCKPKNIAAYNALAEQHRVILHWARPDIAAQWSARGGNKGR